MIKEEKLISVRINVANLALINSYITSNVELLGTVKNNHTHLLPHKATMLTEASAFGTNSRHQVVVFVFPCLSVSAAVFLVVIFS